MKSFGEQASWVKMMSLRDVLIALACHQQNSNTEPLPTQGGTLFLSPHPTKSRNLAEMKAFHQFLVPIESLKYL